MNPMVVGFIYALTLRLTYETYVVRTQHAYASRVIGNLQSRVWDSQSMIQHNQAPRRAHNCCIMLAAFIRDGVPEATLDGEISIPAPMPPGGASVRILLR